MLGSALLSTSTKNVKLFAQRHETETKQFQNSFETVLSKPKQNRSMSRHSFQTMLFQFHFVVRTVLTRKKQNGRASFSIIDNINVKCDKRQFVQRVNRYRIEIVMCSVLTLSPRA